MAVQISGNDITVPRDGTFSRNVSIAGTLTYEDVTNVDSIGLVTARNGIEVGASPGVAASVSVDGNAIFSGITTIGGNVKVGTGVTLSPDGNAFFTGVITATTFSGVDTDKISEGNTEAEVVDTGSDGHFKVTTEGTERVRVGPAGQIGIAGANYGTSGQVLTSQGSGSVVQWATPAAWVYGTAADYDQWGSLTDVEFSGWPSTWQQIRVSFIDISLNANAYIQFFVSKSSSTAARIASGYETTSGYWGGGTNVNSVTDMGRFHGTSSSAYTMNGYVNFFKFSGDKIRFEGQLANKNDVYIFLTNGYVTCDPTSSMTHIFFRGQGYSYDSGKFKLDYLS
tara:strand:- start:286 stop:1302 length:1017 start_codon:yes stop_codon:yes gene_type:complete